MPYVGQKPADIISTAVDTVTGTFSGEVDAASLDISGNIDVDGVTNLDVVDIDGAVDMASTLAVGGVVTANAGVVVDNITIDGTTIALSSGDLTIDVASTIILDGDEAGATVHLKDGGTHWGSIYRSDSNFNIESEASDKDIVFKGNDGGSGITALTLDMSDAGTAVFNHDISLADNGKANFGSSADFQIYHDSSNAYLRNELQDSDIIIQGNDGGSQSEIARFDVGSRGMAVGVYNGVGLHTMVVGGNTGGNATFKAGNTSTSGNTTCILAFMDGSGSASVNSAFLQGYNGSNNFYLLGNGTHSFTSDENAKKNIETTRDGYLEDLAKLRVVKYNWKEQEDGDDKELGLIAQEVEKVFPKLVMLDFDPQIEDADKKKMIKSTVLPFMILKGLQEANTKIEALTARIVTLENE